MQEISKGLLVCLPFLLAFLFIPNWFGGSPDYSTHYTIAEERYAGDRITQPNYAPLLPTLLGIFTVRDTYFAFATMFLILVVTPLLIVLITRTWLGALFYFTTSSYLYFMAGGLLAQALLGVFVLGLFATKNIYARLGLVVLGAISHSWGPPVMIGSLFIILFYEHDAANKMWAKIFPLGFCSPVWGKNLPTYLGEKINNVGGFAESMSVNDAVSFVTKMAPFPFLIVSLKGFWDRREHEYLMLFAIAILLAYLVNVRILLFAALIVIIGFTKAYSSLEYKRLWIILAFGNGLLLVVQHHLLANKIFCP